SAWGPRCAADVTPPSQRLVAQSLAPPGEVLQRLARALSRLLARGRLGGAAPLPPRERTRDRPGGGGRRSLERPHRRIRRGGRGLRGAGAAPPQRATAHPRPPRRSTGSSVAPGRGRSLFRLHPPPLGGRAGQLRPEPLLGRLDPARGDVLARRAPPPPPPPPTLARLLRRAWARPVPISAPPSAPRRTRG